jgi:hypothetical protein
MGERGRLIRVKLIRMRAPVWILIVTVVGPLPVSAESLGSGARWDPPVEVVLDSGEQSGHATATVRIHAHRDTLWRVLTSCAEAIKIVPGLRTCEVVATAADLSWQTIHQVMDYSWYMPRVSYVMKATYAKPRSIDFDKVSGDPMSLRGSWTLDSDGDYTVAHYALEFAPGFWVPRWLVRAAMKRDLPKMLRALRERAESADDGQKDDGQ